jgi:predicted SprT family Zn-dependent metalloprotease
MFWSQEFIDEWNEEHSPRKQLFPDAIAARQRSPTKNSPEKRPQKSAGTKQPSEREAKKAFEKTKHELAATFLRELDETITNGKLAELSASTGGIKLIWTNKLNTTAGRANWKRETIRTRHADPSSSSSSSSTTTPSAQPPPAKYKHHASIELAEKVIDSEPRLLNVLAHEFCHLANFMVSGVTTNPHGREFKAWAAQCSRAFGDRGIQVTTKHSYDIDFKYVWQCVVCGTEFKRHSKSIDPARHRCGSESCRGELVQVKPVPRKKKDGGGGGEEGKGKVSGYQAFVKEQMRVVRGENPGSPQKEIMRIVAGRWAARKGKDGAAVAEGVREVQEGMEELAL